MTCYDRQACGTSIYMHREPQLDVITPWECLRHL